MGPEADIEIRLAHAADAEAIAQLIHNLSAYYLPAGQQELPQWLVNSFSAETIASNISSTQFDTLVAFSGNALAGVIALRDLCHVHHLFVVAPCHGRGIARKLWQTASSRAELKGGPQIFSVRSSIFAVPVYQKLGFVVTGEPIRKDGIEFVSMSNDGNHRKN